MTREKLILKLKEEGLPEDLAKRVADDLEADGELDKIDDNVKVVVKQEVKVEKLYPKEKKYSVDKDGNLCVGGDK